MIRTKKILNKYKKVKVSTSEFYDMCYKSGVIYDKYPNICSGDVIKFQYRSFNKFTNLVGEVISVYGNRICKTALILLEDKSTINLKLNSEDIAIEFISKKKKHKNRSKLYYKIK